MGRRHLNYGHSGFKDTCQGLSVVHHEKSAGTCKGNQTVASTAPEPRSINIADSLILQHWRKLSYRAKNGIRRDAIPKLKEDAVILVHRGLGFSNLVGFTA